MGMASLHTVGPADDNLYVAEEEHSAAFDFNHVDPCFADARWAGWYRPLPRPLAQQAYDHLTHRISRRPENLDAHLHRIMVARQLRRDEAVYGALLDLFIVLRQRGFALRQRLLNKFAPRLSAAQQRALRQALLLGIDAVGALPHSDSSRLSAGLVGSTCLVIQIRTARPAAFSALEEARDLIDSGLLDEARQLLETALQQHPGDEALSRELLTWFRSTRDTAALQRAWARLAPLQPALRHEWEALLDALPQTQEVVQ